MFGEMALRAMVTFIGLLTVSCAQVRPLGLMPPANDRPLLVWYERTSEAMPLPRGVVMLVWSDGRVVYCGNRNSPGVGLQEGRISDVAVRGAMDRICSLQPEVLNPPFVTVDTGNSGMRVSWNGSTSDVQWSQPTQDSDLRRLLNVDESHRRFYQSLHAIQAIAWTLRPAHSVPVVNEREMVDLTLRPTR